MSTRKRTSAMVESALITAIAIVFTLISSYIPFLTLLSIFLPVPFIIIGAKNGFKYSILSLVIATFMIGSFTDPFRALLFLVTAGLGSVVIGYMIQKKHSFSLTIFLGSISSIVSVLITFALMPRIFGFGPIEMIENAFVQATEMYKGMMVIYGTQTENLEQIIDVLEQLRNLYLLILPAAVIMSAVFTTYINYLVSGVILRRIGFFVEKPKKLSYFRLPNNFMMGSLIIIILTFLANRFNIVNTEALNANIVILFQIIFMIQGLGVTSFFIERKGIGNALRRIILIFILIIGIGNIILFFIGLFDVILNFRKLEK